CLGTLSTGQERRGEPAHTARGDLEGTRQANGRCAAPRRQRGERRERPALLGGRERAVWASGQTQLEVTERKLRSIVERRRQLTGDRVGDHLAGQLDQCAVGFRGHVDRQKGPEWIVVLFGQVHRALDVIRQGRRRDFDRADLRCVRARRLIGVVHTYLVRSAGGKAARRRR